jgi:SAM-dependent methyltransferase
MTQRFHERLQYHPELRKRSAWYSGRLLGHSTRKVDQRLTSILNKVDVKGKVVADLGCSGGFFCFRIAEVARHVWGVDADARIIERNRLLARDHGFNNVTFLHSDISPRLMNSLPKLDVTLFMSVFHHMLTASEAYDWNRVIDVSESIGILRAVSARTNILVFEMGYPNEGYEWCDRMPAMVPNPREWITDLLLRDFGKVDVIPAPAYSGLTGTVRHHLARRWSGHNYLARVLNRLLALDPRDGRDIFVAHSR